MLLRPTHSRVIMAAAITGRDSTARYSAMRGPTAAWRAMAQGGPHQEAMAISLFDLDCSLQTTRRAMKRAPVTAVLTGRPSMLRPEMNSPTAVPAALNLRLPCVAPSNLMSAIVRTTDSSGTSRHVRLVFSPAQLERS
jgi:hypothetical protein